MYKKSVSYLTVLFISFLLCSCSILTSIEKEQLIRHYSDKNNFIECTGEVTYVNFANRNGVFLEIEGIEPDIFSDTSFVIRGYNVDIVKSNNICDEICVCDIITFISDPEYFGDGYIMPIVGLSKGNKVYLNFDVGYKEYMSYLYNR